MRYQCLVFLLLAGLAFGQAAPPATSPAAGAQAAPSAPAAAVKAEQSTPAAPENAPEVTVGPNDPVITIKGFCADATLQGDACKTVITRAQFDKLADLLQPGMSPAGRRQLANLYPGWLRKSAAAEKRGLDKGPTFDEMMRIARMQVLAQELNRALQEDSAKVSDADIEDYYKKNEASYEIATLARIFVPRTKQFPPAPATPKAGTKPGAKPDEKAPAKTTTPPAPTEAQKKAAEEAMKKLADDIRARAVNGEDPDKLQKEAHTAAKLPGETSPTKIEKMRRTMLPANHQAVMDLKPGEVSEVISDANSGYYIYKLISRETLSLETVKSDIQKTITRQRMDASTKGLQGNVDLNDAYFGPTRNPAMPQMPGMMKPPASPAPTPH